MKKNNGLFKMFEVVVILDCIMFMAMTLLSSVQLRSNVMTDLICIKRGFPFTYIKIGNAGSHILLINAFLDFLVLLGVSLFFVLLWKLCSDVSNKKKFLIKGGCVLSAMVIAISNFSYVNAASVSVQSWRIIYYGKLEYNCDEKHQSAVTFAQNKWNEYKPNVISESNSPDVVIRGTTELGLDIAGVTYSYGAIYLMILCGGMQKQM